MTHISARKLTGSAVLGSRDSQDQGQHATTPLEIQPQERLLSWCFAQWIRVLGASWRVQTRGLEILDRLVAQQQPHVVVFWHREYIALIHLLRDRDAVVVTSRSHRGNVIASLGQRFGFDFVQIPDRGRQESLQLMRSAGTKCIEMGVAVDGPMGPDHVVKRGVVRLAAELGHHVVPVSVAAAHKHVLKQRWDHLEIPKLFSRISFVVGQPLVFPGRLSLAGVRSWTKQLHEALEHIDALAEKNLHTER